MDPNPSSLRRGLCLALTALLLSSVFAVILPGRASAAGPFVVDEINDRVDDNVGDGICSTEIGTCTLRAAIQEANASGGTTEITFDPAGGQWAVLSLAGDGGDEVGDLDIEPGVTVRLIGSNTTEFTTTTVEAVPTGDRHFHVKPGARLELELVHLIGASTDGDGGAILNEGEVVISNSPSSTGWYIAISDNSATGVGGAIANRPGAQLEIRNVSTAPAGTRVDVSRNSAARGGAIDNAGGTVSITGASQSGVSHDVYIDSNEVTGDGGGIHNSGGGSVELVCRAYVRFGVASRGGNVFNDDGTFVLADAGADGGSAVTGGGIYNDADASLVVEPEPDCDASSSLGRSTASEDGGGLFNLGDTRVEAGARLWVDTAGSGRDARNGGGVMVAGGSLQVDGLLQIEGTIAELDGGGLALTNGGVSTSGDGLISSTGSSSGRHGGGVSVTGGGFGARVLLQSNNAGDQGGALSVSGEGSAKLDRSAILSNSAQYGGGASVRGLSADLSIVNSTIAKNAATQNGGGVWIEDATSVLRHSTLAENAPDGVWSNTGTSFQRVLMARHEGSNCAGSAASTGDFNVFDESSCGPNTADLTDAARFADVADLLEGDVGAGAGDAYRLDSGHPAIDWVTDAGCGDPNSDQSGTTRPLDGDGSGVAHCDSGAIESEATNAQVTINGTVRDETTGSPIGGACVFALPLGEDGDGFAAVTNGSGQYTNEVFAGQYLIAFFVPAGSPRSERDCGETGFDPDYQPEWYRNVAIEFNEDPDADGDVVFPDMDEVTLVDVAATAVTGVDACLGAGPGAGSDAPCPPESAAGVDDPPAGPAAPAARASSDGDPQRVAAAADDPVGGTLPRALAFTGVAARLFWLGLLAALAGAVLVLATRSPSFAARWSRR